MLTHKNFHFDHEVFRSLIGGVSAIDTQRLNVSNLDEAQRFLRSYGYDVSNSQHLDRLWSYYRRAIHYIQSHLLKEGEGIPAMLSDPHQLKDLAYLLIYASTRDIKQNSVQNWSCAILRVMHVLAHLENDLFAQFAKEIREQILTPLQKHVHKDPVSGIWLGGEGCSDFIRLQKFVVKSFKSSESSINKLLAKSHAVAFSILDKLGVRFVTRNLIDVFRVLRFLNENNLVCFVHGISDECNNTLYPINLFFEVMEGFSQGKEYSLEEIDLQLMKKLERDYERGEFRKKPNSFSSEEYKFIKFITRQLIRIKIPDGSEFKEINFFYPFEIQIIDYETYLKNISGSASHEQYKKRQRESARRRVLNFLESPAGVMN